MEYTTIGMIVGALILGIVLGFIINKYLLTAANDRQIENAKLKAEGLLKEAELRGENMKQEKLGQANQKYQSLKDKFEQNAKKQKEKLKKSKRQKLN